MPQVEIIEIAAVPILNNLNYVAIRQLFLCDDAFLSSQDVNGRDE